MTGRGGLCGLGSHRILCGKAPRLWQVGMPKLRIRDYVYLDVERIFKIYKQVATTRPRWGNIFERVRMSIGYFSAEIAIRDMEHKESVYLAINRVERYLERNDHLGLDRPSRIITYQGINNSKTFYRETAMATKLMAPLAAVKKVSGLKALAVWVLDPDPRHLGCKENFEFYGTFLYLVESYSDDSQFELTRSGCSALKAVVNIMEGNRVISLDVGEKFGRGSYDHPVEKLEKIGFERSLPQKIETLYCTRYMTDEQCFQIGHEKYRTCDLLAYPIYIARSSELTAAPRPTPISTPRPEGLLLS